jgi:pullulanase/glycogen debranching enzyme
MLATLLLSDGIPFLLGGDELGRTQQGNNNAYCQDNALSWFSWDDAAGELQTWITDLIALRGRLGAHGLMSLYREAIRRETLHWYHPTAEPIRGSDWDAAGQVPFAASIQGQTDWVILLFNPGVEPCRFDLSMVPRGVPQRLRWGPTGLCDRPCDQHYIAAPRTVQLIAVGDQTAR